MSKDWDDNDVLRNDKIWRECLRVLRPDGIFKAFAATRTYHRLCRTIKTVGFVEVRLEAWLYGCLTDDAEILTEKGWVPGVDVKIGDKVMCWRSDLDVAVLMPVEDKTLAPFDGDMVAFVNDNTDQLLTPNHRVYKKHRFRKQVDGVRVSSREPEWTVMEAAEINRWQPVQLPLAAFHEGPGLQKDEWYAELLGWVWTEGGFDKNGTGVRLWQSSVNPDHVDLINTLLETHVPEHKHYERTRNYKGRDYVEHCWFFSGEQALRVRGDLPGKHPTYDLLWRMTLEEKEAFSLAALRGDGSNEIVLWQKNEDDLIWYQTLLHMTGRQGRINLRKWCCGVHNNPTTELQQRHLTAVDKVPYKGNVWCVKVPTGAFFARRNGQVFITGNSGFPKSTNISKMIDRQAGAEREVVGTKRGVGGENMNDIVHGNDVRQTTDAGGKGVGAYGTGAKQVAVDVPVTIPFTEMAKLWEGYGTGLKPAWEAVVCGRKKSS